MIQLKKIIEALPVILALCDEFPSLDFDFDDFDSDSIAPSGFFDDFDDFDDEEDDI